MVLENLLWVFLIAASPIVELRGALPVAICVYDIPWYYALPICYAGNLLPVPFLLLFFGPAARFLSRVKVLGQIIEWVLRYTRRRGRIVERYERIGLMLFVAIPLPGTGAWAGSIVAFLLGLKFKHSILSITLGVFIAGIIVLALCLLGLIVVN